VKTANNSKTYNSLYTLFEYISKISDLQLHKLVQVQLIDLCDCILEIFG